MSNGHTPQDINEFLYQINRLVDECERRSDVSGLDVIEYMVKRIKSCKICLESINIGLCLKVDELRKIEKSDITELIQQIGILEKAWLEKLHTAKEKASPNPVFERYKVKKTFTGKSGRPTFCIDLDQVFEMRGLSFTFDMISKILGVHRSTLWRRIKESGREYESFSSMTGEALDTIITDFKTFHPLSGERMVIGMLRQKGYQIQRKKIRDSIHRVDPINTALRWIRRNPRWVYSVPGPNSLWHNDGLHKLIRWGFIVHACMDGYSRMITSLLCATNNLAATAFGAFLEGVTKFGNPSRVRGDGGTENNDIELYMTRVRGNGSYIRGPSVHNQRIERLHYDTTHFALVHYINLFKFMEEHGILDCNNGIDLFSLHYIYSPKIQNALNEFQESWNHHPVSTEGNKTPYQIWTLGMMDSRNEQQRGVNDFIVGEQNQYFGIDPCIDFDGEFNDAHVNLFDEDLNGEFEKVTTELENIFDRRLDDGNFGIDLFTSVKRKVIDVLR